jgi:hypothetical protein
LTQINTLKRLHDSLTENGGDCHENEANRAGVSGDDCGRGGCHSEPG